MSVGVRLALSLGFFQILKFEFQLLDNSGHLF